MFKCVVSKRYVGRYPGSTPPAYLHTAIEIGHEVYSPKNVLIVDDDPFFRSLLKVLLNQTGLRIAELWEAESSQPAIAICQTKPVDLIFCDLNLPAFRSRNGIEIVRELRNSHLDIPIYMVTADNTHAMVEQARMAGATGHILKPINLRILKQILLSAFSANSPSLD